MAVLSKLKLMHTLGASDFRSWGIFQRNVHGSPKETCIRIFSAFLMVGGG